MIKKAPKPLVDTLIRLRRKYWKTGDIDLFPAIEKVERELSVAIFGNDEKWSVVTAIVDLGAGEPSTAAIQNATNAQIYAIFNACGINVSKDDETGEEAEGNNDE